MCEYCDIHDIGFPIIIWEQGKAFRRPGHQGVIMRGVSEVFLTASSELPNGFWMNASIEINFCPWCGRDLRGGDAE